MLAVACLSVLWVMCCWVHRNFTVYIATTTHWKLYRNVIRRICLVSLVLHFSAMRQAFEIDCKWILSTVQHHNHTGNCSCCDWLWSCCVSSGLFNNSLPSCQAIKSLNALLASATAWSTLLRWDVYSGRCLVCLGLPLNSPVHSALQSWTGILPACGGLLVVDPMFLVCGVINCLCTGGREHTGVEENYHIIFFNWNAYVVMGRSLKYSTRPLPFQILSRIQKRPQLLAVYLETNDIRIYVYKSLFWRIKALWSTVRGRLV